MAQRLVRAKAKIRGAGIPYHVPADEELAERLDAVMAVVYLVFNEGYAASFGARLVRHELCEQAIRLGRLLVELLPAHAETQGPARADAPARRAARGPPRRTSATSCCSRIRTGRAGTARRSTRARRSSKPRCAPGAAAGPVRAAGGDRGGARTGAQRRRHRLAADRRAVRRARTRAPHAGGRAQPRGRGRDGGRARAWARAGRRARPARRARRVSPVVRRTGRAAAPARPLCRRPPRRTGGAEAGEQRRRAEASGKRLREIAR